MRYSVTMIYLSLLSKLNVFALNLFYLLLLTIIIIIIAILLLIWSCNKNIKIRNTLKTSSVFARSMTIQYNIL